MYLGPSATSKGFRFYDPDTRKVLESRDVIWYDSTPFFSKLQDKPQEGEVPPEDPFEEVPETEAELDMELAKFPEPQPESGERDDEAPTRAPSPEPEPRRSRRLQGFDPVANLL
jgi:hypothetical protein